MKTGSKKSEGILSGAMNALLRVPFLWSLSQVLFGCDTWKMATYRSVFRRSGRMLDFGCANGNTFHIFKDFEYYGLDSDEFIILDAKKKYKQYSNAHFQSGNIFEENIFEEDFFDEALFACTGHHLADDELLGVLSALGKVIRPEGRIHFFDTIANPEKDHWFVSFKLKHDRGSYIRTKEEYRRIFRDESLGLKIMQEKSLTVDKSLTPQPGYFYVCFGKTRE